MDRARLLLSCLMVGVVVILGGCYLNFLEPLVEAEGVEVVHDDSLAGTWEVVPEASERRTPAERRWQVQDTGDSSYEVIDIRTTDQAGTIPQHGNAVTGKLLKIEGDLFWTIRMNHLRQVGAQPVTQVYKFERPSPDRVILYGLDHSVREDLGKGQYDDLKIRYQNRKREPLLILGNGPNRVEFLTRLVEEGRFNEKIVYERVSEPEGNE